MEMNEYQTLARRTAVYPDLGNNLVYPTLALVDEAGEVAGKVKKLIRDKGKSTPAELSAEEKQDLKKEVGDVLWYVATMASELDFTLEDVAQANLDKLKSRQERGQLHGSGDNR